MVHSWIHEVLLSFFHYRFHLRGVAVYGLPLTLAVTYSVFWMTRRLTGRFWGPSLLSTLCCAAFLFKIYPRPAFFSMMFFAILLTLLLRPGEPAACNCFIGCRPYFSYGRTRMPNSYMGCLLLDYL